MSILILEECLEGSQTLNLEIQTRILRGNETPFDTLWDVVIRYIEIHYDLWNIKCTWLGDVAT